MKKQFIISTALIAMTTPMIVATNIETKVESNPTELGIQTKDITDNLYRARNSLIQEQLDPHNSILWSYEFEDVMIIVPDIKHLYLNDLDLSYDIDNASNDNNYKVGLEMDIEFEYSIEWKSKGDSMITNKNRTPLYLDTGDGELKWSDNASSFLGKDSLPIYGEEWVYSLESIGEYLMEDHYFLGNNLTEVKKLTDTYIETIKPFIVNGSITWKEELTTTTPTQMIEYSESWKITENSNNVISVYGQRFDISTGIPSSDDLFKDEYLIEEDTFETKLIFEEESEESSLSGGVIAGIVIGSIAGVALITGGGYLIYHNNISWKKE